MAKHTPIIEPLNTNLFAKTEPEPSTQPTKAKREGHRPIGVYLSDADKDQLDVIIGQHEGRITKHMLLQYAVQRLLSEHRAGTLQLETEIRAGKVVLKVP